MILEARALTRSFGRHRVIGPLDLQLDAGERLALTGENGSGKSTLLRCLAGTLAPSSGVVEIGGHPAGSRTARSMLGASLAQERSFYLRLTGLDNLLTFARIRASARTAYGMVTDIVSELEIEEIARQRVDRCSSGMVQQLALARALLGEPQVVLLDEPTRSLDEGATARLWRALERRIQMSVVIATHVANDLDHCERHLDLHSSAAS